MATYLGKAYRRYDTRSRTFTTIADGVISGVTSAADQADLVAQGCTLIPDTGVPYTGLGHHEYDLATSVYRSGLGGALITVVAGDVAALTAVGVVANPSSGVYVGTPHKIYFTPTGKFTSRADGHILGAATAADIASLVAQGCKLLAAGSAPAPPSASPFIAALGLAYAGAF